VVPYRFFRAEQLQ